MQYRRSYNEETNASTFLNVDTDGLSLPIAGVRTTYPEELLRGAGHDRAVLDLGLFGQVLGRFNWRLHALDSDLLTFQLLVFLRGKFPEVFEIRKRTDVRTRNKDGGNRLTVMQPTSRLHALDGEERGQIGGVR